MVEIFSVVYNEETYIQDFIDWYKHRIPNCVFTFLDNESRDKTVNIIKNNNNCNVLNFGTNNYFEAAEITNKLCSIWKTSNKDWVILVDADEYVDVCYRELQTATWNINICEGYDIYGENENIDQLLYGVRSSWYDKPCIINKTQVLDFQATPGLHKIRHISFKEGFNISYNPNPFKLFHMKNRCLSHVLNRTKEQSKRRSDTMKKYNHGNHLLSSEDEITKHHNYFLKTRVKVR
jgi:hypothetical protein